MSIKKKEKSIPDDNVPFQLNSDHSYYLLSDGLRIFFSLWKDVDPGLPEVDDAKRWLAGFKGSNEIMAKEQFEKLSTEVQDQLNDALHETLCKSIITLLQDTLKNPGLMKEEIQSTKDFAELKPDTDAAKDLLEFLDSEEVREAVIKKIFI